MHYCFALIGRNIPVLCAYIDITVLHCRYDSFDAIYVKCSRCMVPTCICSFMRILLFRFCAHGVDLLIIVRDIVILTYMIYTLCPSKFDTLLSNVITLSNIGRFSNFFSILIGTKFVTSLLLKFPTDPKHVSKLPCETKMFKMCCCFIIKTRRQYFKHTTLIFLC